MKQFNVDRRQFALSSAALALGVVSPHLYAQSSYPNRDVRIYVGASAGGAPDAAARTMGRLLAEKWGSPVVIENKPGISGFLAAEVTSQAAPDGYSICLVLDTVLTTVPLLTEKLPIEPINDLKPIGMVGGFPLVFVANPSLQYRNMQDVIVAAKAKPGGMDYASSGLGSSGHVATEIFSKNVGIKMSHIPYKGGLPALQDVVAGHVPVMWSSVGAALPLLKSGKLVALGIGSAERFSLLPDVPTVQEQGFPNFTAGNWFALMGPAALPDSLAQTIYSALQSIGTIPAYQQTLLAQGIEARSMPSAELSRLIRTEYDRNKSLFGSLGVLVKK